MLALLLIAGTIICAYSILIISFYIGWKIIPEYTDLPKSVNCFISVVVAVRNEEETLPFLIKCFSNQKLPPEKYEVLIIDDHSTDATKNVLNSFANRTENIIMHSLPKEFSGKKEAVRYGVNIAKGELIITTDADCIFSEKWLEVINDFYTSYHPDMIIGQVMIKPEKRIFSKFQALEFLSLIASGAGASGLQNPIMCNAANLAFKKDMYLELADELNDSYVSGDDMFLMLAAKKHKKSIKFLKAKESIVITKPEKSVKKFINQRLRWASKSSAYTDSFLVFTQFTVFFTGFLFLALIVFAFFNVNSLILLALIFIIKTSVDVLLLYPVLGFFRQKKLLRWFLPLQVFYFLYIIFISFVSQFVKFEWKGRG